MYTYPKEYVVRNAVKTPDGTVLRSMHSRDCVTHHDSVDNKLYMVDGGLQSRRWMGGNIQDLSIVTEDHMVAREHLTWGTMGKNGDEPLEYKPIKDLETDHIVAILKTQKNILEQLRLCFVYELLYRTYGDVE